MAREPYSIDRIGPGDADLGISGMGRDGDDLARAATGAVRTRRDQAAKPLKGKPKPGLTALWTTVHPEPFRPLTPAEESRRARIDYRKAARNIFGRAS